MTMNKLNFILCFFSVVWLVSETIAQTTTENYLKTTTYRGTNATNPLINITYFDGLGRPIQQIAHGQSGSGADLITHLEYDEFGRQIKEYLPYQRSASLNIDTNPLSNLEDFYDNLYGTDVAYSEKLFDNSPLNRLLKQAAPGDDWEMGSGHEIKYYYDTNTDNEVYYFKVTNPNNTPVLVLNSANNGNFPENHLYKITVKDENAPAGAGLPGSVVEYKNKLGQVVLKRVWSNTEGYRDVNPNVPLAFDTYYVYDDYGNLTFVLPPLLSEQIVSGGSLVSNYNDLINELGYRYKYDHRNRMVSKKLPGKRPELIAYDPLNRVVAVGPVNSPFENDNTVGVIHTRYDQFNRVVFTYWVETGTFEETHRQAIENSITSVVSESPLETPETDAGTQVYFTRDVAPQTGKQYLTKFAYDRYQFEGAPTNFSETILGQAIHYNNSDKKPKGMPTAVWVRALEDLNTLNRSITYMLYDKKGRTIRTHSTNYTGGYTQTDAQYNNLVDSKVVKTVTKHKRTNSDSELTTTEDFTYTAQDRLEKHTHKVNSLNTQLLSLNTYDALGQLISKKVGGTDISGSTYLQNVNYQYNIRGWLTDINNVDNLSISPDPVDLFAFRINYNGTIQYDVNGMVRPLYNGNIAETTWRTASDNTRRRYAYSYDYLNRLRDAWYQVPGTTMPVSNAYNEHLTYDSNGNILTLFRTGEVDDPDNVLEIDDLEYEYYNDDNSNRLKNVTDATTHSAGFNDGNTGNDPDFEYDDYGNLIIDRNKGITEIVYNHLNLPKKITFDNNEFDGTIEYIYDANGTKLKKTVTDNTTNPIAVTTIHYIDGFQYNGNTMDFFPTAEGYVKVTHSSGGGIGGGAITYNYVFNYTDHLGNIRLRYAINPVNQWLEILEEDHYYPFGLKHQGYNAENYVFASLGDGPVQLIPTNPDALETYKYKFQGQERQDEFGLNWDSFKYRNYMPDIGRFFNIDPLAEQYSYQSPYNFAENRVVDGYELEGLEWVDSHTTKNLVYDPSANNGKGAFTKHATNDHRNLANSLNTTETGKNQFNKLVNSNVPTTTKLDTKNAPVDSDGGLVLGETTLIIAESGYVQKVKDDNGNVVGYAPEGFEIVLFEKNINAAVESVSNEGGTIYGKEVPKGTNFSQVVGISFGHEIEHATPEDVLHGVKNPNNVEGPATEVSNKIIDELQKD